MNSEKIRIERCIPGVAVVSLAVLIGLVIVPAVRSQQQRSVPPTLLQQAEKCASHQHDCLGALIGVRANDGPRVLKSVTDCNPHPAAEFFKCKPNEMAFVTVKRWVTDKRVPDEVEAFAFYRDGMAWLWIAAAPYIEYVPKDRRANPSW